MRRTFEEINEKIKKGEAVVFTAEEAVACAKEQGVSETCRKVDVVTCATFGAMCSSGAFLNFGHAEPPIRMGSISLNDVEAYGGLAAVDTYIGATQPSQSRGIEYGGAHVIEDLIAGKSVRLEAYSGGTDCYPRKSLECDISLAEMNEAYLFNPRNCYQNYSAAINCSDSTINTYMGTLSPNMGNITYSTSGELSPLLKDPYLRTIGMGSKLFMAGAVGRVAWNGTQFYHKRTQYEDGVCDEGATLALIGNMKDMNARYIRGATMKGYGCTMYIGLGFAIPVLDEDLARDLSRGNDELFTSIYDYSAGSRSKPNLGRVSYQSLRSGKVEVNGKYVPASPLSSLYMAREIAGILKNSVSEGKFSLQEKIEAFDMENVFHPLKMGADID